MEKVIRKMEADIPSLPLRKCVAAYARVSSGKDAMLHSLSAQVSYYSEHIQSHPEWEYAGVYVDEALTGTKDNREGFQRLLADCRVGKVDMVLTKSISRFARNTVTLLETVRELKTLGADVYFEEQNIHSLSGDGELMLTILASYAQEESRSVSENCKWRIRQKFQQGIPVTTPLTGYRICKGEFTPVPEEAALVKMIFCDYADGLGRNAIQRKLAALGARSCFGGEWTDAHLRELLRNEKYTGDVLMQKYFRPDHLAKKDVANEGQLDRYFVENHHAPLIDRTTFDVVQRRMNIQHEKYAGLGGHRSVFSGMIRCLQCGKSYKRKTTHGKAAWQCTTYLTLGKSYCHTKQIPEDILMAATASVLGTAEFDEENFRSQIERIEVPSFNHLVYIFKDGRREEHVWQDKSRRGSWTDEMKKKAAEYARKGNQK